MDVTIRRVETGREVLPTIEQARMRARAGQATSCDILALRVESGQDVWDALDEMYPMLAKEIKDGGWRSSNHLFQGWGYFYQPKGGPARRIVSHDAEDANVFRDLPSGWTLMDPALSLLEDERYIQTVSSEMELPILLDKVMAALEGRV